MMFININKVNQRKILPVQQEVMTLITGDGQKETNSK